MFEYLDRERRQRGWSIPRFAKEVGVSFGLAYKWLAEDAIYRITPSPASCEKIARALGADPDHLLALAGHRPDRSEAPHDDKVSYELLRRLERMQALLDAGYPKATLLAVLDANIQMAEIAPLPPSKPEAIPASNPPGGHLEPGNDAPDGTLRCLETELVAA